MISYIKIKNFAVVEKTELELSEGFNVLTGETGAGKSIIIDALSLLFKKKIQAHLFRNPNERLVVEVMFEIEDEEIILKREASKSKSLAYINGDMVPFVKLSELTGSLLNIYGQNEHIYLLNTKNHLLMLDLYCKNEGLLKKLGNLTVEIKAKLKKLIDLEKNKDNINEKKDYLKFQLNELEDLGMERGDDELLRKESKIQASAEEIIKFSNELVEEFYQGENSIYGRVANQFNALDFLSGIYPELLPFKDEINRFYSILPELSETLSNISGKIDYDENAVNEIEEKLLKLNKLEAKHKTDLNGLIDKADSIRNELAELEDIDVSVSEIKGELDAVFTKYRGINNDLRKRRNEGAEKLSKLVEKELSKLEMKNAKFEVSIKNIEPDFDNFSPSGTDSIEFYFSSNLGRDLSKIKDVASGGELSRLMLVLKSIIDDKLNSTYIFDEIDTGIGGKTAEFVGHKLKSISEKNQVICISHLPQIAAFADKHFLIKKEFRDNDTFSYTEELIGEDRVREIGRLMAGSNVDNSIMKAAKTLLDGKENKR